MEESGVSRSYDQNHTPKLERSTTPRNGLELDDSRFYGLANCMAQICEAYGSGADNILRFIMEATDKINTTGETWATDSTLIELEHLMIEQFFDSPYHFQPLDGSMAFRMLVLHPGHPMEPLRGTLQHDNVREKGSTPGVYYVSRKYEAISYVWGSESKPCTMLLNGCRMPLTQTLFNALVRLRDVGRDRRVWADGLCINQEDAKEKAAQVALMPLVYTYASKVLVHLGEQSALSELVPDLIQKIIRLDLKELRDKTPKPEELVTLGLPPPDHTAWKALVDFFGRPWFTRIWVIQEVVLARDVRFFCGEWEMKWRQVAQMGERFDSILFATSQRFWSEDYFRAQQSAASVALMHGFQYTRSIVARRLCDLEEEIESPTNRPRSRNDVDSLGRDLAAKREFVVQSCRKYSQLFPCLERTLLGLDAIQSSTTSILKLLGVFCTHEASIPTDRLFALVGLAGDITLKDFPPDYNEHLVNTNVRFSRKLVEKGQGLDVLYHATKNSIELGALYLPSWSPHWTLRQSTGRHWLKLGCAYSEHPGGFDGRGMSTEFVSLVPEHPGLLHVRGFRLDNLPGPTSVVKIGIDGFKVSKFPEASKQFFQRTSILMSGKRYFTGETWPEIQCRTLVAGHIENLGSSPLEALHQYMKAKELFIRPAKHERKMNEWSSSWFNLMPDYGACKTSQGYVGLVPEVTSAKDEIFMLQGTNLPFVLRPLEGHPRHFRFIGGCYLHGLMKGKAWERVQSQTHTDIFLV